MTTAEVLREAVVGTAGNIWPPVQFRNHDAGRNASSPGKSGRSA
jgi:hypothetical protein